MTSTIQSVRCGYDNLLGERDYDEDNKKILAKLFVIRLHSKFFFFIILISFSAQKKTKLSLYLSIKKNSIKSLILIWYFSFKIINLSNIIIFWINHLMVVQINLTHKINFKWILILMFYFITDISTAVMFKLYLISKSGSSSRLSHLDLFFCIRALRVCN